MTKHTKICKTFTGIAYCWKKKIPIVNVCASNILPPPKHCCKVHLHSVTWQPFMPWPSLTASGHLQYRKQQERALLWVTWKTTTHIMVINVITVNVWCLYSDLDTYVYHLYDLFIREIIKETDRPTHFATGISFSLWHSFQMRHQRKHFAHNNRSCYEATWVMHNSLAT